MFLHISNLISFMKSSNARSIRNALDRARMRQANRNFDNSGRLLTKADLVTILEQDITKSSIFSLN